MAGKGSSPAVRVRHDRKSPVGEGTVLMDSGVRVKLRPVSTSIVQDVIAQHAAENMPVVPLWHNAEMDRDEPNPNDPAYVAALQTYNQQRGTAAMDALIEFGIDLVDPLPADGIWLKKLARRGIIVNQEDPLDVEFAYKKYIAIASPDDSVRVAQTSGMPQEAIEKAAASFRS